MRFRVAELLVVMCVAAFAAAALARPTPTFEMLFLSLTLLFLFGAIVLAVGRVGDARMFWVGFAICSWLYLCLAEIPALKGMRPPLTNKAIEVSFRWIHAQGFHVTVTDDFPSGPGGTYSQHWVDGHPIYVRIAHAAWALLFGWIGGHATCFVYRRSRQADGPAR